MKVLIDTNIMLDYILEREPYTIYSDKLFELCISGRHKGIIAAHSIINAFFILRKFMTNEERRKVLSDVCEIVEIAGVDAGKIISALSRNDFTDFEDCVQDECAASCGADFIITRNEKDFAESKVKAVSAEDFLKIYGK